MFGHEVNGKNVIYLLNCADDKRVSILYTFGNRLAIEPSSIYLLIEFREREYEQDIVTYIPKNVCKMYITYSVSTHIRFHILCRFLLLLFFVCLLLMSDAILAVCISLLSMSIDVKWNIESQTAKHLIKPDSSYMSMSMSYYVTNFVRFFYSFFFVFCFSFYIFATG